MGRYEIRVEINIYIHTKILLFYIIIIVIITTSQELVENYCYIADFSSPFLPLLFRILLLLLEGLLRLKPNLINRSTTCLLGSNIGSLRLVAKVLDDDNGDTDMAVRRNMGKSTPNRPPATRVGKKYVAKVHGVPNPA